MKTASHPTVLITGGSGLIGGALVERFAREGWTVLAACRRPERVAAAANVMPLELDLGSEKSVRQMYAELERQHCLPSVMIGNASMRDALGAGFEQCAPADFNRLFEVDVSGHFLCAREMVNRLPEGQPGSIVLMSSVYAEAGVDPRVYLPGDEGTPVHYVAVKAAVLGLTRFLAARWGSRQVRVNAIVAGGVQNTQDPQFIANFARKTMLGRMAKADEIAAAAYFLASQEASYITGTALAVDGGFTAW